MNEWSQVFLGVIAVATRADGDRPDRRDRRRWRAWRGQVQGILATMQQDVRPLIARANAIADEASKTAALATAQAQKIDRLVTDLTRRVDETSAVIQQAIITPAREGLAIIAALKAGLGALKGLGLRDLRGRQGGVDDEDALFIG